jgi:hypothetical protein
MNQALYAHMNNKRKMKKKSIVAVVTTWNMTVPGSSYDSVLCYIFKTFTMGESEN